MANLDLTREPTPLDKKLHAIAGALKPSSAHKLTATRKLARGLGWFGIGLGIVELLAAGPLARAVGLRGRESLVRAYGMREIVNGVGILGSNQPMSTATWVGGRVAGDALDLVTLLGAVVSPSPRRSHPMVGILAVAGVAMLDVVCARALQQEAHAKRQTTDYSGRAGLGATPDLARGAALKTFTQPADMRASATANAVMRH